MRHITPRVTALLLGLASISTVAAAQDQQPPRRLPTTTVTADTSNILTVQNDRATAVTVYSKAGRFDRRLGVVAAGQIATIALPVWATTGTSSLQVFARADGEDTDLVTQTIALRGSKRIGLLVPPAGGVTSTNNIVVTLSNEERASTTVTVNNDRDRAVTVFAEQGLYSVRLGEVKAGEQATLKVPASLLSRENTMRVFVRPAGGLDLATQTLSFKKGEHLGVRVAM